MRNGPINPEAQQAVQLCQNILLRNNIDIDSKENMVWAPNWHHSTNYAKGVLERLFPVRNSRADVINMLQSIARDFIEGAPWTTS
jgi:hypothetical protein